EGCTNAYISRLESGHRIPSLQLIHEFARRLNVSPQWLATGVEELDDRAAVMDAEVALRLGEIEEARELYRQRLNDDSTDPLARASSGRSPGCTWCTRTPPSGPATPAGRSTSSSAPRTTPMSRSRTRSSPTPRSRRAARRQRSTISVGDASCSAPT